MQTAKYLSKAALGVGEGEAAQEIGGDIQNLHASLAIGRNVFAVAVAKPRADHQIHAPVQRQEELRYLLGVMLCAIRGTARAYVSVSECWPSESRITRASAPRVRETEKIVRSAPP